MTEKEITRMERDTIYIRKILKHNYTMIDGITGYKALKTLLMSTYKYRQAFNNVVCATVPFKVIKVNNKSLMSHNLNFNIYYHLTGDICALYCGRQIIGIIKDFNFKKCEPNFLITYFNLN